MQALGRTFLATALLAAALPPREIYTFPPNHFIENLAVQANGSLLVTSGSAPTLYRLNPLLADPPAQAPEPVHTFANATGLWGITDYAKEQYAVTSGVWDLAATRATNLHIWTLDLRGAHPVVQHVTGVPASTILNGLAPVPGNPGLLLAADSAAGRVYKISLINGSHRVAFSSTLFTPTSTQTLGINGIRSSQPHLYFTNSAQGLFGRVVIDHGGNQVGPVEVLSKSEDALPGGGGGGGPIYDDFALKGEEAWLASHPSFVLGVKLSGGEQRMVVNETLPTNPTSAAFGRGLGQEHILYVTNGGRFLPDLTLLDGGLVAFHTSDA